MTKTLFIFFLLPIFFIGCSNSFKKTDLSLDREVTLPQEDIFSVSPKWFDTASRFKLMEKDGSPSPHLFYDEKLNFDPKKKTLNFIVETPEGSRSRYKLDIPTGKHYLVYPFCEQKDLKGDYSSDQYPPYTEGVIPRQFDELNLPQKIIVFGYTPAYLKNFKKNSFEARLVGGYVESYCPKKNCLDFNDWLSRLVFIGVNPLHSDFKTIDNLKSLSKVIDLKRISSFIENVSGKHVLSDNFFPAYKVSNFVPLERVIKYLSQNAHYLNLKKLKELKLSCYKLYDYTWKRLSLKSVLETPGASVQEVKEKLKLYEKMRKENKNDVLFRDRFINYFTKFNSKLDTCFDYVYPANINDDPKRFWLFSYLFSFSKLVSSGHYYSCSSNTWEKNFNFDPKKEINLTWLRGCSSKNIDLAFMRSTAKLANLRLNHEPSFRFISYDNSPGGTMNKIYNFVRTTPEILNCKDKTKKDSENNFSTFPHDVKWEPREFLGQDATPLGDIIY